MYHPYAKAIFETALKDKAFSEWSALLECAVLIAEEPQVRTLFNNPKVSKQELGRFFIDVCFAGLNLDPKVSDVFTTKVKNLIQLLAEYHRLNLFPRILAAFRGLLLEHENSLQVNISSAYLLSEASKQSLSSVLKKRFGYDMNVTYDVDKNLIAGLVIRVGDLVIDNSIRDKLVRLKESLIA